MVLGLKDILVIDGVSHKLEITHVNDGMVNGISIDGRQFYPTKAVLEKPVLQVKTVDSGFEKPDSDMIRCSICGVEKTRGCFYPGKHRCKECTSKYNKEYNLKHKPSHPNKKKESEPAVEKGFEWNEKRDAVLVANFNSLGVSGIFDKSLLPGFSMTDIRKRCQDLKLIDEFGRKKE